MPSRKQATTRRSSTPSTPTESHAKRVPFRRKPYRPRENAFSVDFLDRARRRAADPGPGERTDHLPHARRSQWAGPWDVEPVAAGDSVIHTVCRREEPVSEGGGARLAFMHRQESLFGAAALTAVANPSRLAVNTEKSASRRSRLGHPIHDGERHLGHIVRGEPEVLEDFLASFHVIRCLAADPAAAALFIEALDPETLAILGRAIMRRLR